MGGRPSARVVGFTVPRPDRLACRGFYARLLVVENQVGYRDIQHRHRLHGRGPFGTGPCDEQAIASAFSLEAGEANRRHWILDGSLDRRADSGVALCPDC